MKKLALVLLLGLVIASAGVFAEHPDGWSVGPGFQYGGSWNSDYSEPGSGFSVFLKAPQLPIYWGIAFWPFDLGDDPSSIWFRLTGDYYIIDKTIVSDIGFGWFLGVGGYGYWSHQSYDHSALGIKNEWSANVFDFGVRAPVGLSFRPIDFFEIFVDFGVSVGVQIVSWSSDKASVSNSDTDFDLGGGWVGDFGVRFWF
jgi:hypothetical protein